MGGFERHVTGFTQTTNLCYFNMSILVQYNHVGVKDSPDFCAISYIMLTLLGCTAFKSGPHYFAVTVCSAWHSEGNLQQSVSPGFCYGLS